MKIQVIYDSKFGNTKKVADAVVTALDRGNEVSVVHVDKVDTDKLQEFDILIFGAPTHAFRPSQPMKAFLKRIPNNSLSGVKAAVFDTRATEKSINEKWLLKFMVRLFGYAAKPLSKTVKKKGAEIVGEPVGFCVADTKGPLIESELERAKEWANSLISD